MSTSARSLAVLTILLHAAASALAVAEAPVAAAAEAPVVAAAAAAFRAESAFDVNLVRGAVTKFYGPVSPLVVATAFAKLPSFEDNIQPLTSLLAPPAGAGPAAAPSADSGRKKKSATAAQAEEDIASAMSALSSLPPAKEILTPPEAAAHKESDSPASAGGRVAGNVAGFIAAVAFGYLVAF